MKLETGVVAILIVALIGAVLYATRDTTAFGSGTNGGALADACTSVSSAKVAIGHQQSTNVVATTSNRAYVMIEQPTNATNTVSIVMNNGVAATTINGIQLTPATTSSPVSSITLGLNTDNPYTGTVTAITDVGSTTVNVYTCRY